MILCALDSAFSKFSKPKIINQLPLTLNTFRIQFKTNMFLIDDYAKDGGPEVV